MNCPAFRVLAIVTVLAVASLLATAAVRAQDAKAPAVDHALMDRAGGIFYMREVDRARARRTLDTKREQVVLARRVLGPMIAYADAQAPIAAHWAWEVHVDTRDEPLAYCLPGGKIMLSTGLFDRMRLTGPELAVVLAHVIAHALAGDDAAAAAEQYAKQPAADDPNRRAVQLADIIGKIALTEPHDKATEQRADAMALELMARAGVDPRPTVDVWRKISRAGGATAPGFLSLHPVWPGRIDDIEAQVPSILPVYEQVRAEQAKRPPPPSLRIPR